MPTVMKPIFRSSLPFLYCCIALTALAGKSGATGQGNTANEKKQVLQLLNQPVRFLENNGQMSDMKGEPVPFVLFKAEAPGIAVFVTEKGLTYLFHKNEEEDHKESLEFRENEKVTIEWCRVDVELTGANIKKENQVKEDPSDAKLNYLYSGSEDRIYGVRQYKKIIIKDVYPNIDWVFYNSSERGFKYDFIVHPGGDYSKIKLLYSSAQPMQLRPDGSTAITTPLGILTEQKPFSYIQNSKAAVASDFIFRPVDAHRTELSFQVNCSMDALRDGALVIDPALFWGTFFGGSDMDEGPMSLLTDAGGNLYVGGYTQSNVNFPVLFMSGAYYQGSVAGGWDAFIAKFTSTGQQLWCTYFGGTANDFGFSIALDANNNLYLAGITMSGTPALPGAINTFSGGTGQYGGDYFITKFNSSGALQWTRYHGGTANEEWGCSIATDAGGNVFLVGRTASSNLPTLNAGGYFDGTLSGTSDAIIARFSPAGVLTWSTYYGGTGDEQFYAVATDASNNIIITGYSTSTNFDLQAPFQAANAGGADAVVLKFNNSCVRQWATYYGGNQNDYGYSLAVDKNNNLFISGGTASTLNFPLVNPGNGAYYQPVNGGGTDAFIAKLSNGTGFPGWSTYVGAAGNEYSTQSFLIPTYDNLAVDTCNNVYMSFETSSTVMTPILQQSCDNGYYDPTFNGGSFSPTDNFLLQFSNTGVKQWATYVGGNGNDLRGPLAVDPNNNLFFAGEWNTVTNSATYPVNNPGGGAYYDPSYNGGTLPYDHDAFIMKFTNAPCLCSVNLTVAAASSNVLCFGQCTGTATATPSGGTSPYTYSWSNAQTTQTATGLCAGTYTVTVTDAGSNTATATVTITQPTALTLSTSVTNPTCNNVCNGNATATASGGTSGYSYSWNTTPVQTASNATGLCAGNYTVTVTDANGCTKTASVVITQPPVLTAAINPPTNVTCNALCNGSATSVGGGGVTPYSYSWNTTPVQTTANATGLCAGNYTVTITDANGCTKTASMAITQPAAISSSVTFTAATCGNNNGSATVTASGGVSPYTYSWSPSGGSAANATGLGAGIYTVTITDANNCTATQTVNIPNANGPSATLSQTGTILCSGQCTGAVTSNVSGGTTPYTYSWSNSQTTQNISGLCAGTYTLVVTDFTGCTSVQVITISQPPAISTSNTTINVTCNNLCNGSATTAPSGGTSPYGYSWNTLPVQTTAAATGLCAGSYTVTITDANSCTYTASVVITQPPVILPAITSSPATCGNNNGTATVSVSGGVSPYGYSWSTTPIQTTATATALGAGSYTVTITDANNCTATQAVNIINSNGPSITLSQTSIPCNGQCIATATASVSGGSTPYNYSWNSTPVQTTATATGFCAGPYTVTVTDANSCTITAAMIITQPPPIVTSNTVANVTCNSLCNGSATTAPSGGVSPYTYSWNTSPVQTNATATGLCAGLYMVTITDANGCTYTAAVTVTQPAPLTASIPTVVNVACNGNCTGSASAMASGGTSAYSYSWSTTPVQTTVAASGLCAGPYTVTITDANGCTSTANVNITQPPPIISPVSFTAATCGNSNGSATVSVSGGTSPYTYSWSPSGGSAANATGLAAGIYTITITDANNCTATQTVNITSTPAVTLNATSTPAACNGQCTGTATANVLTGTTPYTYSWSNSQTTQNISALCLGTYTLTVTDSNGCTQTASITVGTTGGPTAAASASATTIELGNSSQLNATGGVTYQWSPSAGLACTTCANPVATPSQTTTYCVIVTDVNNCTDSACVTIVVDVPCNSGLLATLIPNAFSPNSDGQNDQLCVPNNLCILNFVLNVYDRWGEKVFESKSLDNCWDGTYKGKALNTAVFVYIFQATLSNGENFKQKGNISLIK